MSGIDREGVRHGIIPQQGDNPHAEEKHIQEIRCVQRHGTHVVDVVRVF